MMQSSRFYRLSVSLVLAALMMGICGFSASSLAVTPSVNIVKSQGTMKTIKAQTTINAPASFVWQTLTSYGQLQNFVPAYKKCMVIKNQGTMKTLDIDMVVSHFMPHYKYQVQVKENPQAKTLSLKRISGDLKFLDGMYSLRSIENGKKTVLIYNADIDSGSRLPGTGAVIKTNVESTLSAVQQQAEQRHQKSLIGRK